MAADIDLRGKGLSKIMGWLDGQRGLARGASWHASLGNEGRDVGGLGVGSRQTWHGKSGDLGREVGGLGVGSWRATDGESIILSYYHIFYRVCTWVSRDFLEYN